MTKPRLKETSIQPVFFIVGIGATGGIKACQQFLGSLANDTGMAFVFIHHLSPTRESILAEIYGRATSMPALEVKDGMQIRRNHVYVIPPNTRMGLCDGVLKLLPRLEQERLSFPIDFFFSSLAQDQEERAISVILSGGGLDGTEGTKLIKLKGGMTFAQDPESANQGGMPSRAIAGANVDFILTPQEIALKLSKINLTL